MQLPHYPHLLVDGASGSALVLRRWAFQPRNPSDKNIRPVAAHPAAAFDWGLVRKSDWPTTSQAVNPAPAKNNAANKRAVTQTNGFMVYWLRKFGPALRIT